MGFVVGLVIGYAIGYLLCMLFYDVIWPDLHQYFKGWDDGWKARDNRDKREGEKLGDDECD